jgi:hypothetical protein
LGSTTGRVTRLQSPPSSVSQKVPINQPPPGTPLGSLWREVPVSRAILHLFLKSPGKRTPSRCPIGVTMERETRFQSPPSSVSQKVPVNEPPSGAPLGSTMERVTRFQSLSNFSIRVPLKRNFTHPSKALGKERPPMFPKTGPPWKLSVPRKDQFVSVGRDPPQRRSFGNMAVGSSNLTALT